MDSSKYKVSIITPAHNDEKFISETIESVLSQTHKNFELIIVNDGSTDETLNIIKSYDDKRIVLIESKENNGAAWARNVAIKKATGDYIAFLDGDDIWEPQKLERQLDFMLFHNYDFSCTDYAETDEKGNPLNSKITGPDKVTHKKLLRISYIGCLTVMYKRSIYPDLEIPNDIKKRNDYALWLKLSERADCYYLHETLSKYRKRKSSISSGSKIKLVKYHYRLFKSLYKLSNFRAALCATRNVLFYIFKRFKYVEPIKKNIKPVDNTSFLSLTLIFTWINILAFVIAFIFGSNTNYSINNGQLMSFYNVSKKDDMIGLRVEPFQNNVFDYEETNNICRSYYLKKNIKSYLKSNAKMTFDYSGQQYPISLCSCPVYNDDYFTEFLHLPLYRGDISIRTGPQHGADYACYIPSSMADQILATFGYKDYDELLDQTNTYIIKESSYSYTFSINNIYLNSEESLAKHWNNQEISDDYWKTFATFNENTIIAYSTKVFMNAKKTFIQFDIVPNYTTMETILNKCFSLSEDPIKCSLIKKNDKNSFSVASTYLFEEGSIQNAFKGKEQITIIICFVFVLLLEAILFVFFPKFLRRMLIPYFFVFIIFALFSLLGELLKTILISNAKIFILFNPIGNLIVYLYLINLLAVAF